MKKMTLWAITAVFIFCSGTMVQAAGPAAGIKAPTGSFKLSGRDIRNSNIKKLGADIYLLAAMQPKEGGPCSPGSVPDGGSPNVENVTVSACDVNASMCPEGVATCDGCTGDYMCSDEGRWVFAVRSVSGACSCGDTSPTGGTANDVMETETSTGR